MTSSEPGPPSFAIRSFRPGDEYGLVDLFRRVFGRSISREHWTWKLRQQAGAAENVWLAVSGDLPIFQYAAIPMRFWLSQTPATVMVSVDTMTAPEFRRRGLLTDVAGQAYRAWRDAKAAFVIGLPNEQWGSRTKTLGWQVLFPLQWLVRPLRPEVLLARRLRLPWLGQMRFAGSLWNGILSMRARRDTRVQTALALQADGAFDRIWEKCKTDWMFTTVRDREWVNWRFFASPSRSYVLTLARRGGEPTGYTAHSLIRSEIGTSALLAELIAARADTATRDALLSDLIDNLIAAGADSVLTLAIPGTPFFRWLRRRGFIPRRAFSVQMVPLGPDLPMEELPDRNRWNLTGADFDVV